MNRLMLAAGPWMSIGANMARRIVLYRAPTNQLVVHSQTYEPTGDLGREVCFEHGDYFKENEMRTALKRWDNRNHDALSSWLPASLEFATQANNADLASQYVKEKLTVTYDTPGDPAGFNTWGPEFR